MAIFSKIRQATTKGTGKTAKNGFEIGQHKKMIKKIGIVLEWDVKGTAVVFSEQSRIDLGTIAKTRSDLPEIIEKFCGMKQVTAVVQLYKWKKLATKPVDELDLYMSEVEELAPKGLAQKVKAQTAQTAQSAQVAPQRTVKEVEADIANLLENRAKIEHTYKSIAVQVKKNKDSLVELDKKDLKNKANLASSYAEMSSLLN